MAAEATKVPFVEGSAPSTPAASRVVVYAKADGLMYSKDDAGTETLMSSGPSGGGGVAADSLFDAKGDLAVGTGANTAQKLTVGADGTRPEAASGETTGIKWSLPFTSYVTVATPAGLAITGDGVDTFSTNATAQIGRAAPILIPGRMRVRSLWVAVSSSAAGSIQWGLFDYASSLSGATKLAGGSSAPGGTGWREIAASGAPVAVNPGQYMLIVMNPASTPSTLYVGSAIGAAAPGIYKAWSTYSWDDTPDFTSGSWSDSSLYYACYLEGDLDASSTRW